MLTSCRIQFLCLLPLLLLLNGCSPAASEAPAETGSASGTARVSLAQSGRLDEPLDPPGPAQIYFQVDVYQFAVPFGTIGGNEAFWKRINEQGVDVATYDLLYKNGIRVGEAPLSELRTFRDYLSEHVATQKLTVTAQQGRNIEVPMKSNLPEQHIFYFDGTNRLVGNSFHRSDNVMTIAFQPTPRRPGHLRMTLCPMVRAHRKVIEYSLTNEARELAFVQPERLYDLNLTVDIPRDSFLVVTASEDARRPSSVGHAFMMLDGHAERMEQVLLVLPRPYVPADPGRLVPD